MNFGKTPLVAAALAAVVGATAIGAGVVSAAGGAGNGPFADLAGAIATHFNLDATEVQEIIDEQMAAHQEERHAEMQANMAERLTAAVTSGKLTQAQADALTAHQAEMEAQRDALKDLSPEEAHQQMEAHRAEMDTFLQEQGIDREVLHDVLGRPEHGGPRGGHRGEDRGEK